MATALIIFDQSPGGTRTAGHAVDDGVTGNVVTVTNNDNSGVTSWSIELVDMPTGPEADLTSALSLGVLASGGATTPTTTFTPDVPGSYLIRITLNGVLTDEATFAVPDEVGLIRPPSGGEGDAAAFGGQLRGWAYLMDKLHEPLRKVANLMSQWADIGTDVTLAMPDETVATGSLDTTIHAQDNTAGGSAGGDLTFRPGSGTSVAGSLAIQSGDGTPRVTIGTTGNVDVVTGQFQVNIGAVRLYINSAQVRFGTNQAGFASGQTPTFTQDNLGTASGVGATFTIHAQDCTGATSTGADLHLRAGTGTSTNGVLELQDAGGTPSIRVGTAGHIDVFGQAAGSATMPTSGDIRFPNEFSMTSYSGLGADMTLMTHTDGALQIGASNVGVDSVRLLAGNSVGFIAGDEVAGSHYIYWTSLKTRAPDVFLWCNGVQTTNATVTTAETYAIPTNYMCHFTATVIMRSATDGDSGSTVIHGTAENTSGTVSIVGTNSVAHAAAEDGTWGTVQGAPVIVDASGADIRVRVEGGAGDTVNWNVELKINRYAPT